MAPQVVGKSLALLKQTVPTVSPVAVLWNPNNVTYQRQILRETEMAAGTLDVEHWNLFVIWCLGFGAPTAMSNSSCVILVPAFGPLSPRCEEGLRELFAESFVTWSRTRRA